MKLFPFGKPPDDAQISQEVDQAMVELRASEAADRFLERKRAAGDWGLFFRATPVGPGMFLKWGNRCGLFKLEPRRGFVRFGNN